MGRLIPEHLQVDGDVNIDVNFNIDAEKLGKAVESIMWTFCVSSVVRSWFRK